ncbi:phosphatase of regenerating liver-type phosphatase, putative [Trypanosoma equiperdum]|uniref:Protein tyrosine phosphatase PRL-1 n=2 Tax=Trypanozoon TaxID=39700 RepID=Q57YH9_TRYB2|nr:protein tyrosine phosphatase, putative [Trypanosoma brucei brucei TREU927]AAX69332.1 protein tyrosine phosphatase, putative [Trypanosoma brucei]AAZ13342.1 protein tyrosine phosphatase, putative [Trypanosoma brucei brucei TREU927]SCU67215.1 phosphatase of regenerating liver-type phosphatase, putative [Trypanosoma equiperdum]
MDVNCTLIECLDAKDNKRVLFNFLILDAPSPSSLPAYLKALQRRQVRHLVRVCGPTYDATLVEKNGIEVHSWPFDDGAPPPRGVLESWFRLLDTEKAHLDSGDIKQPATIAIHCVAGLGRAPILVAVALVEYGGLAPLDTITLIRERRRGAINQTQMHWLVKYKRRGGNGGGCAIM